MEDRSAAVIQAFLHIIPPDHLAFVKCLFVRIWPGDNPARRRLRDADKLRCITALLYSLPQLSVLNIDYPLFIAPLHQAIASKSATLTELSCSCSFGGPLHVARLVSALPLIRILRISEVEPADNADNGPLGPAIASLEHLVSLSLSVCYDVSDSWADLDWKNGSNMLDLMFEEVYDLTSAGLTKLLSVFSKSLKRLVLYDTPSVFDYHRDYSDVQSSPNALPAIDAPNLEYLSVGTCSGYHKLFYMFKVFGNCPVTTVDLYDVDAEAMEYIMEQFRQGFLPHCRRLALVVDPENYSAVSSMGTTLAATSDRTVVIDSMSVEEGDSLNGREWDSEVDTFYSDDSWETEDESA